MVLASETIIIRYVGLSPTLLSWLLRASNTGRKVSAGLCFYLRALGESMLANSFFLLVFLRL